MTERFPCPLVPSLAGLLALLLAALSLPACSGGDEEGGPGAAAPPAGAAPAAAAPTPEPPATREPRDWNLVLISLDTCRADRLSCYGAERRTSPGVDALAGEGAVFTDCLSQSTGTGPSHVSLFTGQFPHRTGLWEHGARVEPRYTLASLLRDAGWRTAAWTGGGYLRPGFGVQYGFEEYQGAGGPKARLKHTLQDNFPHAADWIRAHKDERFFLFLHGYDPHCPYWPPPEYRDRFAGWYRGDFDPRRKCGDELQKLLAGGSLGADEIRYIRDLYDGGVAGGDFWVGRMARLLRTLGLLDRTIVVFLSDHGESLAEHDWIGHLEIWDEQIRVPLVMRFPEGRWAGRYDAPVMLVDVLPTLLEALGVAEPPGLQGRSLVPLLEGREEVPAGRLRLTRYGGREAVRFDRRWKLVLDWQDGRVAGMHLFDLKEDPHETRDLAGAPEGRRRAREILARYREWREESAAEDLRWHIVKGEARVGEDVRAEIEALGYAGQ